MAPPQRDRPRQPRSRRGPPPGRGVGRAATVDGQDGVWLFGLHAVRDALGNPRRRLRRLIITPNARLRLGEVVDDAALAARGVAVEIADPRRFPAPLDPQSVHQGAAAEAEPLDWGPLETVCAPGADLAPTVLALDRVTDPHNVGAILRSAEVFGARAVIAPRRHSAPETGALAKAASGALERQPYLRPGNLGDAIETLKREGYLAVGLDGAASMPIAEAMQTATGQPLLVVLGAEGPGLRERTRGLCDVLAKIPAATAFASLNVSNAAAIALYAAAARFP